jgi:DNA-binding MarR family transcriptional regulator
MQRAARALAHRFDTALKPLGLTNGQFSLLIALNRPDPLPRRMVAALLAMDRSTLTAALKPLEREKLVKVAPDPDDRRSTRLRLTPKGKKVLARALPVWRDTHAEVDLVLSGSNPERLRHDLRALS